MQITINGWVFLRSMIHLKRVVNKNDDNLKTIHVQFSTGQNESDGSVGSEATSFRGVPLWGIFQY
jgi:hypothetical protein